SAVAGTLVGAGVGTLVGSLFYTGEGDFLLSAGMGQLTADMKVPMLVMQGITSLFGFVLVPYFAYRALTHQGLKSFSAHKLNSTLLLLALFITVSFAVFDSAIIEWNKAIVFPEFMKPFETWARDYENRLQELTKVFTQFNHAGEFAVAMLVVAVGAGICEEFLFRGIIQQELMRSSNNIHVSIWVAAFLFSTIHMQFFGFVPRLLLGALFGYLYHWSGNLLVPMFAHFVNNGFSLLMMYLFQLKIVDLNMETEQSAPWYTVVAFACITAGLLVLFKKKSNDSNISFA
ncbi:MAG: type II CAAX prenyl endopeptidase Rce1 family protein, partial [Flammeovirgaceae bacterium]